MIIAVVGSGGKTTLIKKLAAKYRSAGKTVLVTTTTHMFIEADTLLTDDADTILRTLRETGYAMAGIPEGIKIKALSPETFEAVCAAADVVLVDGDDARFADYVRAHITGTEAVASADSSADHFNFCNYSIGIKNRKNAIDPVIIDYLNMKRRLFAHYDMS